MANVLTLFNAAMIFRNAATIATKSTAMSQWFLSHVS